MNGYDITVDSKLLKKSKLHPTILDEIATEVSKSLRGDKKYRMDKNYQIRVNFGGTRYFVVYEILNIKNREILNIKEARIVN